MFGYCYQQFDQLGALVLFSSIISLSHTRPRLDFPEQQLASFKFKSAHLKMIVFDTNHPPAQTQMLTLGLNARFGMEGLPQLLHGRVGFDLEGDLDTLGCDHSERNLARRFGSLQ